MPIDLLFLMVRRDTIKGVDKYVSALYEHLKRATSLAHATADKEAERFKRIYDRRAGAVALHPGDKVLIRIDTFVGARRKLKNRWSSQIHTVVCRVAEGRRPDLCSLKRQWCGTGMPPRMPPVMDCSRLLTQMTA